ncbi:MAG: PrsW family intramembrane metalloprotease, partial [Polyangiaceae bacterium]|nr:PrsW family intramembrane metalloprotease [Polyangiaceae bacterium]
MPTAHRGRKIVGAILYAVFMLLGTGLLLLGDLLLPLIIDHKCGVSSYYHYVFVGASLAIPAVIAYLFVPVIIDRYDPEPWWALLLAFLWGGFAATGMAGVLNTIAGAFGGSIGGQVGEVLLSSVVSAPLVEEFLKGMLILGLFIFLRTEFDGVVDGVVYAIFVALGFACIENITYYANAGIKTLEAHDCVTDVAWEAVKTNFFYRGIMSPWVHPVFTSMFGIGVGIARETNRGWLKVIAPLLGFFLAVFLHGLWNFSALLSGLAEWAFFIQAAIYFAFACIIVAVMIALVVREGRIIRLYLTDELAIGTLTQEEFDWVCSPVGRLTALFRRNMAGRNLVRACATLAIKKWHVTRAMKGKKYTISMDFIVPLRKEIAKFRKISGHHTGKTVPPTSPNNYQSPQQGYQQQNQPQPRTQHCPQQQYQQQPYPQQQYPQQQYPQQQQQQ